MVTRATERRAHRCCSLERIKALAAEESVVYESRRVEHRALALGYSFSEVCKCIAQLRPDDFAHAVRYRNEGDEWTPWLDVYLMSDQNETGQNETGQNDTGACDDEPATDELYIKLRLTSNCLLIALHSFHLEGDP